MLDLSDIRPWVHPAAALQTQRLSAELTTGKTKASLFSDMSSHPIWVYLSHFIFCHRMSVSEHLFASLPFPLTSFSLFSSFLCFVSSLLLFTLFPSSCPFLSSLQSSFLSSPLDAFCLSSPLSYLLFLFFLSLINCLFSFFESISLLEVGLWNRTTLGLSVIILRVVIFSRNPIMSLFTPSLVSGFLDFERHLSSQSHPVLM